MRSSHSPTIRSRYDYYYSSMSPASSAANFYDNQNQSLFGDPVPVSNNFLETLDNHLYGSFRRNSNLSSNEYGLGTDGSIPAPVPVPNDAFIEDFMDAQNNAHHLHMSATKRKQDRAMVTPVDGDLTAFRFDAKRRSSSPFSDEFRANLDAFGSETEILVPTAPKRLFSEEPINYRNLISMQSSDSLNGGGSITNNSEWIRPNIDSWRRDLPPRPASRNVMSIDHGNAMVAILPDSSTPSSGENQKPPACPSVKQIQVLPYRENKPNRPTTAINRDDNARLDSNESDTVENFVSSSSPPKHDISPTILTNTITTGSEFRLQPSRLHKKTSFAIINELQPNQSRPASPAGGRVSPFRGKGFKAESSKRFLRPVSCPESPRNSIDVQTISPSHDDTQLIHTDKPSVHFNIIPPIPRKRSAIQVLDATTAAAAAADDNDYLNRRESFGDISFHDRDMESFEVVSNGHLSAGNLSRIGSTKGGNKPLPAPRHHIQRSANSLSRISDLDSDSFFGRQQQQNVNPRSYHKGLLGVVSGGGDGGVGGGNRSGSSTLIPSRIPRRRSSVSTPNISRNSSISSARRDSRRESNSSDRFVMRRDSSASPRRRITNDFGGSMIDLGMGMTPSPLRSINRISKPTSLSPIVGTPNKDYDQDSDRFCSNDDYDVMSNSKYGMDSPTKIPVRRSSSVNIHGMMSSRGGSRINSRETSPMKSPLKSPSNRSSISMNKSPTKIPQKITGSSPSKSAKMMNDSYGRGAGLKSVHKEASSARKEPASVKKAPSATGKREPSTLKRQPSSLKRENSQQKLKRESSMIDIGGGGASSSKPAKASATRHTPPTTNRLAKNQSDSSLAKRLEKKNSFKQKRRTSSESDGLNEIDTANLSDKLMPLTKAIDGISMTTAMVASQPIQITTAVTDHLSKKNSSSQIVNNSQVNNDNSSVSNISISKISEPNAIGKTENHADGSGASVGTPVAATTVAAASAAATTTTTAVAATITTTTTTTVIEATAPIANGNEIASTASSVNLMTAKATDKGVTISETTTSEILLESDKVASAVATDANANGMVMDTTTRTNPNAVLEKKASTRTLGGKSETSSMAALGTPIVPESIERELIGTPIETKVNVIDRNSLMSTLDNEALLMKPNDTVELHRGLSTDTAGGGSGSGGMSVTHENRLIETMEKDNGITSHIDPINGAKNEMSENGDADFDEPTTCCKLCKCCTPCYASALCLPCRRLKKCSCFKRGAKKLADEQKETEIAASSILHESEKRASSVAGEVTDAAAAATTDSCWKRLKCCKRKSKQMVEEKIMDEVTTMTEQTMQRTESLAESAKEMATKERGKCALCLAKVFCCRKTNKIQTSTDEMMSATMRRASSVAHEMDDESNGRCCCCLPCRRKKKEPMAWSEQRRHDSLISTTDHLPKKGCCATLCEKLLCCKKKTPIESRRTSMNSKKQSIAPTLPPEDTRPKLDESLIDHTSVMKAALPVLPISLAWFCLICNCLIPGSGTLFSGMFCLCLGIPRFSQHDGVRARIGSFLVNTFVGLAQAFTLIFCLVGWGWSIWWGMILLRTARKHRKLVLASMDEEQTITSASNQHQRDVEAGRKRN